MFTWLEFWSWSTAGVREFLIVQLQQGIYYFFCYSMDLNAAMLLYCTICWAAVVALLISLLRLFYVSLLFNTHISFGYCSNCAMTQTAVSTALLLWLRALLRNRLYLLIFLWLRLDLGLYRIISMIKFNSIRFYSNAQQLI